jgi:hypothetical protein
MSIHCLSLEFQDRYRRRCHMITTQILSNVPGQVSHTDKSLSRWDGLGTHQKTQVWKTQHMRLGGDAMNDAFVLLYYIMYIDIILHAGHIVLSLPICFDPLHSWMQLLSTLRSAIRATQIRPFFTETAIFGDPSATSPSLTARHGMYLR